MKSYNVNKKQTGFFDLGLSLLILTLAGGSVYLAEKQKTDVAALEQETAAEPVERQDAPTLAQVAVDGTPEIRQ
jgi:hypothetical protein